MTSRVPLLTVLAIHVILFASSAALAQGVSVNINVTAPPPPAVFVAPPQLVTVPGSVVMYAPGVAFNVFVLQGHYYSFHNGVWFYGASHKGPWVVIPLDKVPVAVRAVPVAYYKIPPGQAKKMAKEDERVERPGRGRGPKGR